MTTFETLLEAARSTYQTLEGLLQRSMEMDSVDDQELLKRFETDQEYLDAAIEQQIEILSKTISELHQQITLLEEKQAVDPEFYMMLDAFEKQAVSGLKIMVTRLQERTGELSKARDAIKQQLQKTILMKKTGRSFEKYHGASLLLQSNA